MKRIFVLTVTSVTAVREFEAIFDNFDDIISV